MSQQGGNPTGRDDDWWTQLYDDSTDDAGPTAAPDSLDDRFASAAGTVSRGPGHGARSGTTPSPPTDRTPDPTPPAAPGPTSPAAPGVPSPVVPGPRAAGSSQAGDTRQGGGTPRRPGPARSQSQSPSPSPPPFRAPGEPPPSTPPGPTGFPPGPERSGARPTERRAGPHGRTTSGSGAADLTEPPAPAAPPAPDASPPLPPLPPPFLPTPPTPAPSRPGRAQDGGDGSSSSPRDYVGSRPPTYDAEPTALPAADPDGLDGLVADTVLDGARYGTCTLRAVSARGDSARYRGDPRRDALLVARFGAGEQALVLVAMATGARATAGAHLAAAEACRWIGRAVGRSHARLAEDLRAGRRGDLKSGLHRLTDRSLGRVRAAAAEQGLPPEGYEATLRCLLLPADPACRTRVFFGVGEGGLLRLRDGAWQNMEPKAGDVTGEPVVGFGGPPRSGTASGAPSETPDGDRLTMDLGVAAPPGPHPGPPAGPPRRPFRFRASVARPGDVLLMCTAGLAEPLLSEPELGRLLARRWAGRTPPGLAEFLADSRLRVKGYADDRTAAAVWEA
ncbi:protein phosphatase 2C domain-containing protein [Streptomyces ziwulingensis]